MKYTYPACIYPELNGQYTVIFPDLDNIATYGNDMSDAIIMAQDLLCTWILDCKKNNENISEPSKITDIKIDNSIGIEKGYTTFIIADLDAYMAKNKKSVKKNLTIPFWLDELAKDEDINYSKLLQEALKEKLHLV